MEDKKSKKCDCEKCLVDKNNVNGCDCSKCVW